jgi:cation diffusion facilitator CzcD-associated flavoprotein CzcO
VNASLNGQPSGAPVVAIVGAGMSGLCMGIKLKRAGIETFTIYEKAAAVGGTWRENTYPGLSCDVPSRFYSYSFEPNPGWTRQFSPGPEIWRYFDRVARRYGVVPHIEFGREVVGARHQDGRWLIRTADGREATADFLISACGVLHHPRMPDIAGLETFAGAAFHSARWDHSVPLRGRRIGVVGNGSTGVQIVAELAQSAGRLHLFQRTAQWVISTPDHRYSRLTRALLRRFPRLNRLAYRGYQAWFEAILGAAVVRDGWQRRAISWLARRNLASVRDPVLRAKLTPDYQPMCKRLVMSSRFYDAVQQDNVEVVTEPIERVVPEGVVTRDGSLHALDVLVLATGFDAHAFMRPMELEGPDGNTLADAWRGEPTAYRTVALPGFPNFFMLMGPHSPIGNQSLITVAETQADYALGWIRRFQAGEVAAAAPTAEATARFNADMRRAMPGTVWATGCRSWYLGADGLPALWPWSPARHRAMLREPVAEDFEVQAPSAAGAGQPE